MIIIYFQIQRENSSLQYQQLNDQQPEPHDSRLPSDEYTEMANTSREESVTPITATQIDPTSGEEYTRIGEVRIVNSAVHQTPSNEIERQNNSQRIACDSKYYL